MIESTDDGTWEDGFAVQIALCVAQPSASRWFRSSGAGSCENRLWEQEGERTLLFDREDCDRAKMSPASRWGFRVGWAVYPVMAEVFQSLHERGNRHIHV